MICYIKSKKQLLKLIFCWFSFAYNFHKIKTARTRSRLLEERSATRQSLFASGLFLMVLVMLLAWLALRVERRGNAHCHV